MFLFKGTILSISSAASRGFHPRLLVFLNPASTFLNLSELNRLLLEKKKHKTKRLMWLQLRVGEAAAAERPALNRGSLSAAVGKWHTKSRAWDEGQKILALETQIAPQPKH